MPKLVKKKRIILISFGALVLATILWFFFGPEPPISNPAGFLPKDIAGMKTAIRTDIRQRMSRDIFMRTGRGLSGDIWLYSRYKFGGAVPTAEGVIVDWGPVDYYLQQGTNGWHVSPWPQVQSNLQTLAPSIAATNPGK